MIIGNVVLPVDLDFSDVSIQAKKLTDMLGRLKLPGGNRLGNVMSDIGVSMKFAALDAENFANQAPKKIESAINSLTLNLSKFSSQIPNKFGFAMKMLALDIEQFANAKGVTNKLNVIQQAVTVFIKKQATLNQQTAAQLSSQARSYLSLQNIATKALGTIGKSLLSVFSQVKASNLPVLGAVTVLGAGLTTLLPVVSSLIMPMLGLTGGVGGLAGAFLNAQIAALNLGSRGLIGLIKTTAELLSSTSSLKGALKGLALPSDFISAFGKLRTAFQDAVTQAGALKAKVDALGANLVSNAQGILSGAQGAFASAAGAGGAPVNPMTAAFDANKGIGEYVAFEQNATAFKSLAEGAGATADQIKAVTQEAKRLGAQTSKSAVEASELSIAMLRLGISADQVDDAMSGIVQTSEATGENLAQIGGIVASAMSVFKLSGTEATKVGDLLGKMANISATSITEIGEALKYSGDAANAANQSLEDVVVVLGAVSASQKGSSAGTNLSSALINLQKAASAAKSENELLAKSSKLTKQELDELAVAAGGAGEAAQAIGRGTETKGKVLEVLGISKEDLLDSEGKLKSLLEIIPVIRQAVQDMEQTAEGTAQVPVLLNTLFGEQGSRTILSLIGQTDEQLNALKQSASTASGFTAEVSEKMLSGISGSLKKLVSATQGVSLIVGETFAPIVQTFADKITDLLSAFLSLPPAFQKLALVGATVMPFMVLYWKLLGFQKQAIAALVLVKKTLILAQTAEGRQQIVLNIQNTITEAKTKAVTLAKATQVTVTKVLRGELSLLAAAQMGVGKALAVVGANYKSYFSTLVYSINQIQLHIKGLGQLALSLTSVNVGQIAHNAVVAIGTGIKSTYLGAVEMVNAAINRHIVLSAFETKTVAKGNIVQTLSAGIAKGLTIAKTALALITGRLSAANLGLAGTYAVLAAQFAIILAAFWAVKKAWDVFTGGLKEAKELNQITDKINALNNSLNESTIQVKKTDNIFVNLINSLKEGINILNSAQEIMAFSRSMESLEKNVKATNATFDNGLAIINKYGLAQVDEASKTRLGAEGIADFTAESKKQVEIINATIQALKSRKPANDIEAEQIANQIKLLENQAMQLRKRSDFLNFDTDITKNNAETQQELSQNLEQLISKYENLAKAQELDNAKAILEIEESLAAQTIKSGEAISEREKIESEALKNRIDLNNQALEELKRTAEWMPTEERIKVEEEISKRTEEAINLRIQMARKEVEEREKLNEQLVENEQQKLQAIEAQQQLDQTQQIATVRQQQASGTISGDSADAQIAAIQKQSIQDLMDLEKQRMESHQSLLDQGAINEQEFAAIRAEVNQKSAELTTELAEHEIQAAENATAKYQEEMKLRLDAQKNAIDDQLNLAQLATDQQINQIKALQLQGELSAEASADKINQIKLSQIQKEIEIQGQALKNNEQNFRQGLIEQQAYVDEKNKISSTILSHEKALLDEQINQQEEAKNKLLEQIDEVADRRRQSFEENQMQQELALKQQKLSGELSSDEIEQAKQQAEIKAAQESVEIARQKLQEIHALESKGLKLSEEILDRKESAEKGLLQAQINLVDQQLAAKKRAEEAAKKAAEEAAKQQEEAAKQQEEATKQQEEAAKQQEEAAQRAIEVEKEKNEQILKDFENRLAAEQSARELSSVAGITTVRAQQLAGIKSKEQAEEAIAQIEQQARRTGLAGLQQQIVKIQQLQNQGVLTSEEAARRKTELNKQLADGNLALIESQIRVEEQAVQRAIEVEKEKNEQILKDFENRLATEQSTRELSSVAGITAARAQQLAGIKSKEQAEEAIAQIEQQARRAELAGLQQQIVKIQQLQTQGVLTAEEAARRKAELNKQLADGNLALIESQIQAEEQAAQRAIEAKLKVVEANLQAARTPLKMQSARSDIASNRLGLSSNLASAETGVLEARNTLEAQRIDFQMRQLELQAENAKSEAERERALLEAEKLKSQAFKNQFVAMQQSQQAAQAQLEISQRQKDIELQRQKISARIALLESQAELKKAKINGASAQEIQALAEMVKLRQETLSFTDEAIAGQEELKKLEAERLQIQQQAEKEKMAQERLLELERKSVEATGQEREHILQQLKEAKKMQSQMGTEALNSSFKPSSFEFPNLDLTPVGAKLKQNIEPMMFKSSASIPKPAKVKNQNFSGDIVGAEKIEIYVNSGDRSSGVDIERTVLNALNTVIDKTKTKINEI